jgi:cysteine-rich repeat protein
VASIRIRLPLFLLPLLALGVPLAASAQVQVGGIYAAESGDGTVVEITGGGDFSAAPRFATGLNGPRDLCIGPNGDLYVSEFHDDEVTIISAGGDFTGAPAFATGLLTPVGLDCSDTRILVSEFVTGDVLDITAGGDFAAALPFASGLIEAVDVFTAADGTIYASDDAGNAIYDITAGGAVGAPFASNGGRTRGVTEWNGTLLVATPIPFEVKDATLGGDLSASPVFASGIGAQVLHSAPGVGLFATFDTEVYEISAGGDFSLEAPFATGLLPVTGSSAGFSGVVYVAGCNDGIVQPDEDCEDGNTLPGDGCDEQCLFEVCGNGVVQIGEECDDGNTVGGDGCDAFCLLEFCGDGIVSVGEVCDDSNTVDGDGCSADCTAATFCTAAPDPACVAGATAKLTVDERKPGKEKLKASVKKLQAATQVADFGDPVAGATVYELCIYDGADTLVGTLPVDRAGDVCGAKAKPCWSASKKGPKYKDSDAASAGVKSIKTAAGDAGKGKVQASAGNKSNKGQNAMPTGIANLLQGQASATLQVHTSDAACFGAALSTVKRADPDLFKAKAP